MFVFDDDLAGQRHGERIAGHVQKTVQYSESSILEGLKRAANPKDISAADRIASCQLAAAGVRLELLLSEIVKLIFSSFNTITMILPC